MLGFLALYGTILVLGILFLMLAKRPGKLAAKDKKRFLKHLKDIQALDSPREQVIRFDTLYHNILKSSGYRGTFGEILKQKPMIIQDIQMIWELHKLRNKLVHELGDISESLLQKKSLCYHKEISKVLR